MSNSHFDVIVIGNGITGLTAARHCAQRGLATATIESLLFGGLVVNINELDGWPGEQMSGTMLASMLMMQAAELGVTNISATVTGLECDGRQLKVKTDAGEHGAGAVIVASGARLKRLGIPGESEFEGRGVSQCADCDGPMYKNADVVVVGGGDSALQEALVLAHYCKRVNLVHRSSKFDARQHLADKVVACANIQPVWNSVIEAVVGTKSVASVRVRNLDRRDTAEIPCTGFFPYIGLEPSCDFVPSLIKRDGGGFLVSDASHETAMPGVFAAGAVRAGYRGMLTDAVAEGEAAAAAAARKVEN